MMEADVHVDFFTAPFHCATLALLRRLAAGACPSLAREPADLWHPVAPTPSSATEGVYEDASISFVATTVSARAEIPL